MAIMSAASPSAEPAAPGFCRDCLAPVPPTAQRCPACRSPRLARHREIYDHAIAHIDCDAFYAAVEKRDDPSLRDKPVIIGGGRRGVVATACYIARIKGVKSAMPMFTALKLCPEAVVLRPNMEKYARAGRQVRALMQELTPLVEPLSIDEAFLDLSGTERLHHLQPARALARLARHIESDVGITVSVGLSHNKFLAKIASDLDKPRGFSVIGRAETASFLAARPVSLIWGVGKAMQAALAKAGITMISQLQTMDRRDLAKRYGALGERLYFLSRGEDHRAVAPGEEMKSISAETTFDVDIAAPERLENILWELAEKVSRRAKGHGLAGLSVTLKLKTADFRLRTRNTTLSDPTMLAERIFAAARPLLRREATGTAFRLIGVGIAHLSPAAADETLTGLDARASARARAELAMDKVRTRFGPAAVAKGRGLEGKKHGAEE
jgi:DNA polymerase-4